MPNQFEPVTAEVLEKLSNLHSPILRFHEEERFFPLLAEAWLTTSTNGIWPESATPEVARLGQPVADPWRRGASLCTTQGGFPNLEVIAGPPIGGDRPISLTATTNDRYSIGSDLLTKHGAEAFLSICGWDPNSKFTSGDLDFLTSLNSELGSAMNRSLDWDAPDRFNVQPWQWIAQSMNPTMYCEITWAGAHPRHASALGLNDFPPNDRSLDSFIAFTYYLLYGARVPATGDNGGRLSEGQWEAITVFYPARAEAGTEQLLSFASIDLDPSHVVISQGHDRTLALHRTSLRPFGSCEVLNGHPVIYVALGSHRNHFQPVKGATYDPNDHKAPGDATTHDNEKGTWTGIDGFLAAFGAFLGLAVLLIVAAAILWAAGLVIVAIAVLVAAALLVLLALVALFLWLASLFGDDDEDDDAGDKVSYGDDPDDATDQGPQSGGDGSESPAGAAAGSGGGGGGAPGGSAPATGTVGLPNTGSPTGKNTISPDIRIIERIMDANHGGASREHTEFPSDHVMENPAWWDYNGRWGARVAPSVAGSWESGWHRIDENRRGWSYWASQRLDTVLNGGKAES